MSRAVTDIDNLQVYIDGVMKRAAHHAGEVDDVALAIAGALVWRKEGPIEVYEREGEMKNALWITIGGKKYAMKYNHRAKTIEIRDRVLTGKVLKSFTNATPIGEVKQFFKEL